jgi:hypothetical protein
MFSSTFLVDLNCGQMFVKSLPVEKKTVLLVYTVRNIIHDYFVNFSIVEPKGLILFMFMQMTQGDSHIILVHNLLAHIMIRPCVLFSVAGPLAS